jgi:hypothetical protein
VDNFLLEGTTRIGHLYDGSDETPSITAQLSRADDQVRLELSLLRSVTDLHEAWFQSQQVPSCLLFRDTAGAVALAGCRFGGYTQSSWYGHASGVIWVEQAVVGADAEDYSTLTGVRSSIDGLARWTGLSSVSDEREHDDESRLTAITVTAESKPAIAIGGTPPLSLTPQFSTSTDPANGTTLIQEQVLVETLTEQPISWQKHLRPHRALQDLLALTYGWPCNLDVTYARREDDPYRLLDGESLGTPWLQAVVPRAGRRPAKRAPLSASQRPLFVLADISPAGVAKWISEYDSLGRSMWPLASLVYQGNIPVQARLLQVATALEALGFELTRSDGAGSSSPGKTENFLTYLRLIVHGVGHDGAAVVSKDYADVSSWMAAFNQAYKGVKHADNASTLFAEAVEMVKAGSLLARLWLGAYLGADPHALADRARYV